MENRTGVLSPFGKLLGFCYLSAPSVQSAQSALSILAFVFATVFSMPLLEHEAFAHGSFVPMSASNLNDSFSKSQNARPNCESLSDTSPSLTEVLENESLHGACQTYFAKQNPTMCEKLLCGKELFFYGDFAAQGLPKGLYDFVSRNFPELAGPRFEKFGMISHPVRAPVLKPGKKTKLEKLKDLRVKYPIGVVQGRNLGASQTMVFTCASCHFGKTPDGRYSVGMSNNSYEYGKQMLVLNVLPSVGLNFSKKDPLEAIAPIARPILAPYVEKMNQFPLMKAELVTKLLPLLFIGRPQPNITQENHIAFSTWKPGTQDFLMQPLPFDDGVHTISRTTSIWDIPTDAQAIEAGMPHQMLGNTGATRRLDYFVEWFVRFMNGDLRYWNEERRAPLAAYMASLNSPKLADSLPPPAPNPSPADSGESIRRGKVVFENEACTTCHNSPAGGGNKIYSPEELGVDRAIRLWADPQQTGTPCCGLNFSGNDVATHGVKVPRIYGVWAQTRLLHNGSIESLEELLCMLPTATGRLDSLPVPMSNTGHTYGCGLAPGVKLDLVNYLKSL